MVIPLSKQYIEKVITISNAVLGKEFLNKKILLSYLNQSNKKAFVMLNHSTVIGFISFEILFPDNIKSNFLKEKEWFKNEFSQQSIGLIKQVLVLPKHQKKGVGSKLIQHVLTTFNNSVNLFICLAWEMNNSIPIKKALIYNHFRSVKTINNYWYKESLEQKYSCIFCGIPPCNCNAIVYIKQKKPIK